MILPIDNHDSLTRNLMHPGAAASAEIHAMRNDTPETAPDTVPILPDPNTTTSRGGWCHREPAIGCENIATDRGPAMIDNRPAAGPAGTRP